MIDVLISRIKDAYYELEGDHARRARFFGMTQAFTPGAIQLSPSQMADLGQRLMGAPTPGPAPMPGMGMPPQAAPQPAPEPSFLDIVDQRG